MNKIKISWFSFTIITAFYITALNYNFFKYIYDNIEQSNFIITTSIIIAYFLSSLIIFSMLFIKGLTKLISILCISVTCIGSYFIYKYSIFLDYSVIGNVFRTNVAEAKSFIDINLMLYLIFALIIPSILILLCKIDCKNHFYIKLRLLLIGLLGICICVLPFKHTIQSFYNDNVQIKFLTLPFYTIYQGYKFVKLELKKPPRTHIGLDASINLNQDGKLLIFIAGESARAANYSIGGGYKLNDTNFYTKQQSNLVYFSNVISCGTYTTYSIPCMFSASTREQYSLNENQDNIFHILAKVGVDITWLSTNNTQGRCEGVCDEIQHNKKKFFFPEFDGVLLEPLQKNIIDDHKTNQIIVLHTRGSHYPYNERYPKEFSKFLPDCYSKNLDNCDQASLINAYDNSILYSDYLLTEIIKITQNLTKDVIVFFISDHGQSLRENGFNMHSAPYDIAPIEQKHVPMMIYSNKKEILERLQYKKNVKLSHDNIFSSILGYFEIQTSVYDEKLDLFK